jgi:hypothetical protein
MAREPESKYTFGGDYLFGKTCQKSERKRRSPFREVVAVHAVCGKESLQAYEAF